MLDEAKQRKCKLIKTQNYIKQLMKDYDVGIGYLPELNSKLVSDHNLYVLDNILIVVEAETKFQRRNKYMKQIRKYRKPYEILPLNLKYLNRIDLQKMAEEFKRKHELQIKN